MILKALGSFPLRYLDNTWITPGDKGAESALPRTRKLSALSPGRRCGFHGLAHFILTITL